MAKVKQTAPLDPIVRSPALTLRAFEKEIEKLLDTLGTPLARQDAAQLSSVQSYTIVLFMADYAASDVSQKQFATLLDKYDVATPGNLKTFPFLSQSALFEIFANIGVSRETIRRLLILLSQYGLLERVSKGPPFPDQLAIAKAGSKLMNRVAKRLTKELERDKMFSYL